VIRYLLGRLSEAIDQSTKLRGHIGLGFGNDWHDRLGLVLRLDPLQELIECGLSFCFSLHWAPYDECGLAAVSCKCVSSPFVCPRGCVSG